MVVAAADVLRADAACAPSVPPQAVSERPAAAMTRARAEIFF
ncbi:MULTISPECIES: hypothetical protein [unclassified Streptomyces]|nr:MULTISPECIES: hypothetical protein [unclassified Streptomyces]